MAHLGVLDRDDPVRGHPLLQAWIPLLPGRTGTPGWPFHILQKQLCQELRPFENGLLLVALHRDLFQHLPGGLQQTVGVGHDRFQELGTCLLVAPTRPQWSGRGSISASPFTLEA
jgi:hypothetical protein